MRADANSISTNLISQIVAAAHDFECELEGTKIRVVAKVANPPRWPASAGTPPPIIELSCSWPTGSVELEFCADRWPQSGKVALKIALAKTQAQILWMTLPKIIGDHPDGAELSFPASITPFKRKGDGNIDDLTDALKAAFDRSGIPKWKTGDWRALGFIRAAREDCTLEAARFRSRAWTHRREATLRVAPAVGPGTASRSGDRRG